MEHTASPFYMNAKTPHELIDPAVRGTTGILESVLKHGYAAYLPCNLYMLTTVYHSTSVKRVVITSSVGAVMNPPDSGTLDETSWNLNHPKEVEEKGADAPGHAKVDHACAHGLQARH